ncbi:hypothetical protein RKE29_20860 [Streptomyces sp. B1866]|uniref:hypothetical protein n=1 Tax=Streptomyces sp. B1866 TaxID=3075431 RepID=UPI002891AD93|nr:hypothetical protein [Streptomyces sp. B1866]MDT3399065.1 hypothetical protein [Streptomyces sp. B1866]
MSGTEYIPGPGDVVVDTQHGKRLGIARAWDEKDRTLTLKEPGGRELWDTTEFRAPTDSEALRARVAEVNHRSRWGRP